MSGAPHCGEVMVVGAAVMAMVVLVMVVVVVMDGRGSSDGW